MAGTMHLSPRDLYVYERTVDWRWEGDVASPQGAFTSVDISPEHAAEYHGHYIVVEDNQGFVHVWRYPKADQRDEHIRQLAVGFEKWDADADDDSHGVTRPTSLLPIQSQGRRR